MTVLALILVPLAGALLALLLPSERYRPLLLPLVGLAHLALTASALVTGPQSGDGWVHLDALGLIMLGVVSLLFAICAWYAWAYLRARSHLPNRVFSTCLLIFLSMATLMIAAQHLGLLWVAMEATTLASAALLYFERSARSLEATWKYLMIGSVGIALALLGSLFVAYAAHLRGRGDSLLFMDLLENAGGLSTPWLRSGFVFLLVGYGTKMGLAPLHSWKPDAYAESPGLVGALLSGALTSCAFLALLRVYRIVNAAGEGAFARELLVFMGLLSMAVAAVFMVRQRDFKRLLAYSSVEHMGILVLGVGLGGAGTFGSILHVINNGLTKGALFLAAANIHRAYGSKLTGEVSGAMTRVPLSGALFFAGFLAVTGSPPFAPFVSEFAILTAAFGAGSYFAGALYLALLAIIFIGMGGTVLSVVLGRPSQAALATPFRETFGKTAPIVFAMALVLMLGLWLPDPLRQLIEQAAAGFEVQR